MLSDGYHLIFTNVPLHVLMNIGTTNNRAEKVHCMVTAVELFKLKKKHVKLWKERIL